MFLAAIGILIMTVKSEMIMQEVEHAAVRFAPESPFRFIEAEPVPNQDTIIGIGADYDIQVYKKFIGSIRKSGFSGNIILGMSDQQHHANNDGHIEDILSYLHAQNVIVKTIQAVICSFDASQICLQDYAHLKPSMASYFLVKKWLGDCIECNGLVMLAPIPNVYFQDVPFNFQSTQHDIRNPQGAIHLFEMPATTENWRVALHLSQCKDFQWDVPLLSSIVIGDRMSTLFYFEAFLGDVYDWQTNKDCKSNLHGKELAMHNYLFYNGDYRAKVHEYEESSGLITFVTNEEYTGKRKFESSSPIIASMDDESSIASSPKFPFRAMAMEYYSLVDRQSLAKFKG